MLKIAYLFASLITLLLIGVAAAFLWLRAPDLPREPILAKYTGADDHFLDLPGEIRLHYRDQGKPDAPALILLHGYGDSYATWEGWAARLAGRYRVLSLDLPGHGLSDAPEGFTLDGARCAELVASFADALHLERFAVAGNSMGGGIAWRVALAHPQRVSALILAAAAGWPPQGERAKPSLAFRILQHPLGREILMRIDNRPLIAQGLRSQVHDAALITDAVIDRWAEYQLLPGHRRILMSAVLPSLQQASAERLAAIRVPTLILHGADDPLIPSSDSQRFHAAIAASELIIYPDVGHLPQREIPERSAGDVADFLARHAI
ncbi:alpha/beta fold hydrolase [Rhodocyclus tenuis]|nr:alpha/beta fold hydrolase [Rhodocyclus gracilis]